MDRQDIVLVDESGDAIGVADRTTAHQEPAKLHLAFSIFVFNNGRVLLQRRHPSKLFGNLWTNTCCSHVKPSTGSGHVAQSPSLTEQAKIRLEEEFGFTCPLIECGSFIYKAEDTNGIEYEYDTVLVGAIEGDTIIKPDPTEILEWKWMNTKELKNDLKDNSKKYTPWLSEALKHALGNHP